MTVEKTNSKLTPTQERILDLQARTAGHLKRLLAEPWRNLTDTPANRAKVELMVKGASAKYGPRLNPDKNGDIRPFDALRLMYAPRVDMAQDFDLDDFLSSGEEYQGETHLAILVSFDAFLMIVKRVIKGLEGLDVKTRQPQQLSEHQHLRRLKALNRVLRHVETFSCWRDEGVNEQTGKTFLFNWPKEQAQFAYNFYEFSVQEKAYDAEDFNAFGLRFRARPVDEVDESYGPDDTIHPDDAKRATAREYNREVREKLSNLIGE